MSSVKESLYHSIEQLSEEEVREVLAFIQNRPKNQEHIRIITRLSSDPAVKVPEQDAPDFHPVQPIPGKGKPASRLLVEERR